MQKRHEWSVELHLVGFRNSVLIFQSFFFVKSTELKQLCSVVLM